MKLESLLCVIGLAAAPTIAAADTKKPHIETYSWSYSSKGRLGAAILGITPELRTHFGAAADRGVLVAHVEPNSAAAKAGLAVGDVITEVRGKPVGEAGDVIEALSDQGKGAHVVIAVIRGGTPRLLDAVLTEDAPKLPPGMKMMPQGMRMPAWMKRFDRWDPFDDDFDDDAPKPSPQSKKT